MPKTAQILDVFGGLSVFGFLIWTTYFGSTDYTLTFWSGIGVFALLFIFSGIMHMIPYIGASALPVAWEWWWHDISISEVSLVAWIVAAFSLATKNLVYWTTTEETDR